MMAAAMIPRPGAAKGVVPKKGIGIAFCRAGVPRSADIVKVSAPKPALCLDLAYSRVHRVIFFSVVATRAQTEPEASDILKLLPTSEANIASWIVNMSERRMARSTHGNNELDQF
jgi:hypothetical protein